MLNSKAELLKILKDSTFKIDLLNGYPASDKAMIAFRNSWAYFHFVSTSPDLWWKLLVKRKQPFIFKIDFLEFHYHRKTSLVIPWKRINLSCYHGKTSCYSMIMTLFFHDLEITDWIKIVATMATLGFRSFMWKLFSFWQSVPCSGKYGALTPNKQSELWGSNLLWHSTDCLVWVRRT